MLSNSVYSLNTYVGVKIMNLSDDPANSCVGSSGYPSSGRIQALSSILPSYPIYMEIRNSSGSVIGSGNAKDSDYTTGDILYFPTQIDLDIGADYTVFFDVDAIRIYLPLVNTAYWTTPSNNNYWTTGQLGANGAREHAAYSSSNTCGYSYVNNGDQDELIFLSSNRTNFFNSCMTDWSTYNCDGTGFIGIETSYYSRTFRIGTDYNNLHLPNIGNFNVGFTFE